MMKLYSPTDHGYAWIVVAGAAFMGGMTAFAVCGLGVLMVEYIHYFNITKTQVSWIGTSNQIVGTLSGRHFKANNTNDTGIGGIIHHLIINWMSFAQPFNTIFNALQHF